MRSPRWKLTSVAAATHPALSALGALSTLPALSALGAFSALSALSTLGAHLAFGAVAAAARPQAGTIGTAHPIVVDAVDPGGRWVVLCQAREDTDGDGAIDVTTGYHGEAYGDALRPYLVWGEGEGEPITRFIAAAPDGDWLAIARDGRVELVGVDGVDTRAVLDLGARGIDAAFDVAFSPDGRRVLWVADGEDGRALVVRTLATGEERRIDPGEGPLVDVAFDASGAWLLARRVEQDTDGDGTLAAPRVISTLGGATCRGTVLSFSSHRRGGDDAVVVARRVEGDDAWTPASPHGVLGTTRIVVDAARTDATVFGLEAPDGTTRWLPALPAGARVVTVSEAHRRAVVVTYDGPEGDGPDGPGGPDSNAWLLDEDGPRPLGVRVSHPPEAGEFPRPVERFAALWLEPEDAASPTPLAIVDLATGALVGRGDVWLAQAGARLLLREAGALVLLDVDADRATTLLPAGDPFLAELFAFPRAYSRHANARFVAIPGGVVDLEAGRLARHAGEAHGLDPQGRVLVAAQDPADWDVLATGPLRWIDPFAE